MKSAERIRQAWPELEKFLVAGPVFVGFIPGIWRYAPGHIAFETGFQSLLLFVAYMGSLIFAQILDSLFFSAWPLVLGITRSVLALAYVALALRQYFAWRSGTPHFYAVTKRLRSYLAQITGNAF